MKRVINTVMAGVMAVTMAGPTFVNYAAAQEEQQTMNKEQLKEK